jgi:hypothetical protein
MPRFASLTIAIALTAAIASCGARTDLAPVGEGGVDPTGIPCGTDICRPRAQLCAHCDLPDDDGSFDPKCIDIPESIPDWWGARYPDCERPVATFHCRLDAHCSGRDRCITEGRDTFCTPP